MSVARFASAAVVALVLVFAGHAAGLLRVLPPVPVLHTTDGLGGYVALGLLALTLACISARFAGLRHHVLPPLGDLSGTPLIRPGRPPRGAVATAWLRARERLDSDPALDPVDEFLARYRELAEPSWKALERVAGWTRLLIAISMPLGLAGTIWSLIGALDSAGRGGGPPINELRLGLGSSLVGIAIAVPLQAMALLPLDRARRAEVETVNDVAAALARRRPS